MNPGTKVDRLYIRDGVKHWVKGYRVFDPNREFPNRRGITPVRLKRTMVPRMDEMLIVTEGQFKPMRVKLHEVRPHAEDAVSFADVFGTFGQTDVVLAGVERAKVEDLTIGLDYNDQDQDED